MKMLIVVCVIMVIPGGAFCQTSTEELVRSVIVSGAYDGHVDKLLSGVGDAAAVAITKVLGEKLLSNQKLTPADVSGALLVIHLAFSAPRGIEAASDRQPKTTLFVLQYLSSSRTGPARKKAIYDTKQFVLGQVK